MFIWNWFFAICSAYLTRGNGSTTQFLLHEFLSGLTYGFLIKNFQEIKLFIGHRFIHDINKKKNR